MQKQLVAIAFVTAALVSVPLACSSSSNTGGTTPGGDSGTTPGGDGGTNPSDGGTTTDSGGCVPVGAVGNADGVGKYCATLSDCLTNSKATLCATLGGDPTQDFCTFSCTPADGGTDPCGGGGAICDCQGGQCGCVPTSCQ